MAVRTLHLVLLRSHKYQRAHFGIFVPSAKNPDVGTVIHVVGNPMLGFSLEFKRNHNPEKTVQHCTMVPIGTVDAENIVDFPEGDLSRDKTLTCNIEVAATQVPPPRKSQNFLSPVDGVNNRRCQEWTIDYVRHLVNCSYLDESAVEIVQSQRDPPGFGIGLRATGFGGGAQIIQAVTGPADPSQQKVVAVPAPPSIPATTIVAASNTAASP